MLAKVTNVIEQQVTAELSEDATAGQDTFTLEDISVLAWPSGQITIGGFGGVFDDHDYTVVGAEEMDTDEVDVDETEDPDGGVITIDPPAIHSYSEGTFLWPAPYVFERLAYLFMEDQEEEIVARVPQSLYDRIPVGTREDPEDAETVEIELRDNEYVVTDLIGEPGTGQARGYAERLEVVDVTGGTTQICEVLIEIPTPEHRIMVFYSATLSGSDTLLGFDDNGLDFEIGIPGTGNTVALATADSSNQRAQFFVPSMSAGTSGFDAEDGTSFVAGGRYLMVAPWFPYGASVPTVGLHHFRLTGWREAGTGLATVSNAKLWIVVI